MRVSALSALVIGVLFLSAGAGGTAAADLDRLVGQPADIAPSAYQYRADRKAEQNAPESWLALMRYANQPLNKPVDRRAPAIKQALCGLLWEEIRPVQRLELTWTGSAQAPARARGSGHYHAGQPRNGQFLVEQPRRGQEGDQADRVHR